MARHRFIVQTPDTGKDALEAAEEATEDLPFPLHVERIGVSKSGRQTCVAVETEGLVDESGALIARELTEAGLRYVEDRPVQRNEAPTNLISASSLSRLHRSHHLNGEGVAIAILDKHGVAAHEETFGNRLSTYEYGPWGYEERPHLVNPADVEGTNVAAVAAGAGAITSAAPQATILAYRTEFVWDMMQAIEHALHDTRVCVIVTAWHLPPMGHPGEDGFDRLIASARNRNVVTLVAAGNSGSAPNTILEPASYASTWAVGMFSDGDFITGLAGADSNDRVDAASSRGLPNVRKPDFLEWSGAYTTLDPSGAVGSAPGTSMAVARAAGVFATWYQAFGGREHLTPAIIEKILAAGCVRLTSGGPYGVNDQGLGALDEAACEREVLALARRMR